MFYTLPEITTTQFDAIIKTKEECYINHISDTTLNVQLVKILKFLNSEGFETILLTDSRKNRTQQVCEYYSLTPLFDKIFCFEDYNGENKYRYFNSISKHSHPIVLFENDKVEIRRAMKNGISENQIITIKF